MSQVRRSRSDDFSEHPEPFGLRFKFSKGVVEVVLSPKVAESLAPWLSVCLVLGVMAGGAWLWYSNSPHPSTPAIPTSEVPRK
jgi:hypothetical protein